MRSTVFFISFAVLAPLAAHAQQANIGTLTCTMAQLDPGKQSTDERAVRCTFKPARGAPEETYGGTISEVGGTGLTGAKSVLIWAVNGPEGTDAAHGSLAQTYVGRPEERKGERGTSSLRGQSNSDISLRSSTPGGEAPTSGVIVLKLSLQMVPA